MPEDGKTWKHLEINGFQTTFRKDNCSNGGGGLIAYVRNSINARRREDLGNMISHVYG